MPERRRPVLLLACVALAAAGCAGPGPREQTADITPPAAFLRGDTYPNLTVEFYFAPGSPPTRFAIDALEATLRAVVEKQRVILLEPVPLEGWAAEERAWPTEDLERVAVETSDGRLAWNEYGSGETAILQVFYLDGRQVETGGLGVMWGGRVFTFLGKSSTAGPLPPPIRERWERAALIHETGHALGLVNCGIPMVKAREDPESDCHSTNSESVMWVGVHVEPKLERLTTDTWIPFQFDADDLADIEAFQRIEPRAS